MESLITRILPVGKQKYHIYLDEEFAFVLYRSELFHLDLQEGMALSEALREKIYKDILYPRAVSYAVRLLTASEKSTAGIRERLKKTRYPAEITEKAIEALKANGLLEDKRFAETYVLSYRDKKSKRFMRLDLQQQGIDTEIIEEVLSSVDDASQQALIRKLLLKKGDFTGDMAYREQQKLVAYLVNKGFEAACVRRVLGTLVNNRA